MMKESHLRSVVKGLSWRLTGTLDTVVVSLFLTGNPINALKIGFSELFTKIPLFYLHERIWLKTHLGRKKIEKPNGEIIWQDAHWRSFAKAISWRLFGTWDTVLFAWLWTGDVSQSLSIGVVELFTKLLLFYLHERAWHFIKWGQPKEAVEVREEESAETQVDFSA